MDIISPDLIWIAGRCYRVNEEYSNDTVGPDLQEENDCYESCALDIEDENEFNYPIEPMQNGRFRTSFHIPQFYWPQIIGSKGAVKKRIEIETKTQIRVPRQGQEGSITVIGSTEKSVISASRRIDLIVTGARNKQPFTHFLSIPFNNIEIKNRFLQFKNEILESNISLSQSLFQTPEKLHLTLGTMCLMDNEDRALAAELLKECKHNIINPIIKDNGPLKLQLSGIEIMNDDPSAVDVLYGYVNESVQWADSGIFQNMAGQIVNHFIKKGLMQKQYDHVKLHVTLMNSLFCQENDNTRNTFNASNILKSHEFFEFGTQEVQQIHLSQRYSTGCDNYYQSTMTIDCQ